MKYVNYSKKSFEMEYFKAFWCFAFCGAVFKAACDIKNYSLII